MRPISTYFDQTGLVNKQFIDKLIKMVNFKLGNEMWRWINQHDTSVGQRKILSPWQELNPWPPENRVGALSTELWELMVV